MNLKFTLFLFWVACLFSVSCSNRVEDDLAQSGNFLKVTIDGDERIFTDVKGRWVEGGDYLEITAVADASTSVSITVLSENGRVPVGEYVLDDDTGFGLLGVYSHTENDIQHNYAASPSTISLLDAFSLKIQNINDRSVEGTFSGRLIQMRGLEVLGDVVLTDGSFFTAIASE